ncbi:MAG: NUDIX domain-containing protein [bacterium]|nr:NUDIX domain-containing protein [bacterium]
MATKKKRRGWIEPLIYAEIQKLMPILCVDIVIQRSDGKFLLLKRRNYPAKGKWWTPGSKLDKGERLSRAAIRIAKEEVGMKIQIIKRIGSPFEMFFRKGPFETPVHVVEIIFLVRPVQEATVRLDFQSDAWRWASKLPKHLPWASIVNEAAAQKD